MKEVIKIAVKYLVLGLIATALILAGLTLYLAMPDIFNWVAGYIGEFMTWVIFISIIGSIILYCVAE